MTINLKNLKSKLKKADSTYTDKEIIWLIDHIGDPNSSIRDNLVCNSFGYGFFDEKFTREQVSFLIQESIKRDLLFYKISAEGTATLTRSFTCLLWDLFIQTNENSKSKYFAILKQEQEEKIFNDLIKYLSSEHDFSGYSEKYGWVHAIAHCSDALEMCIKARDFDKKLVDAFLVSAYKMFNHVNKRFIDAEEWHLADVFTAGFQLQKINEKTFIKWANQFNLHSYQFNNLKAFMEDLYIKLNRLNLLTPQLKKIIEQNYSLVY